VRDAHLGVVCRADLDALAAVFTAGRCGIHELQLRRRRVIVIAAASAAPRGRAAEQRKNEEGPKDSKAEHGETVPEAYPSASHE
jgi:hypothetical protein